VAGTEIRKDTGYGGVRIRQLYEYLAGHADCRPTTGTWQSNTRFSLVAVTQVWQVSDICRRNLTFVDRPGIRPLYVGTSQSVAVWSMRLLAVHHGRLPATASSGRDQALPTPR